MLVGERSWSPFPHQSLFFQPRRLVFVAIPAVQIVLSVVVVLSVAVLVIVVVIAVLAVVVIVFVDVFVVDDIVEVVVAVVQGFVLTPTVLMVVVLTPTVLMVVVLMNPMMLVRVVVMVVCGMMALSAQSLFQKVRDHARVYKIE